MCVCVCVPLHCIACAILHCKKRSERRTRIESTSFFLNGTGLLSSSQSLYFLTLALIDEVFVDGGGEGRKDQYHRHPPRFLNYLGC